MNKISFLVLGFAVLTAGCATSSKPTKVVIWEAGTAVTRAHEVLGPVSVREEISESNEDTIGGLAGYISKDGRVSDQIPADMKATLEAKRVKYKEMIFDKLGLKAKEYGADAVISVNYSYLPAYASFSSKAVVTAEGQMVKYK